MKTLISSSPPPPTWKYNNNRHKTPTILSQKPTTTSDQKTPKGPIRSQPPSKTSSKGFSAREYQALPPATKPGKFVAAAEDVAAADEDFPQVVFERMMGRIGVSVGVPLAAGLAALKLFGEAKVRNLEIPVWVQIVTLLFTFGLSTVGLAYGALSSSWDAEKSGSLLGFEEAQKNWVDMWREEDEYNNKNNNNK